MATIEELLGLSQDGWKEIALMDDIKLQEYLKDITNLERNSKIVNVNSNKINEDEILNELIDDKDKNPFTKARQKKSKRKPLSTYNIDIEAKQLEKELEELQ